MLERCRAAVAVGAGEQHRVRDHATAVDTDVRHEERTVPTDEGDHERFSHYVDKDKLTEAMVMGTPVVALCGKVWVPSRAPEKFPVCPECKEVWESLKDGRRRSGSTSDAAATTPLLSPRTSVRPGRSARPGVPRRRCARGSRRR